MRQNPHNPSQSSPPLFLFASYPMHTTLDSCRDPRLRSPALPRTFRRSSLPQAQSTQQVIRYTLLSDTNRHLLHSSESTTKTAKDGCSITGLGFRSSFILETNSAIMSKMVNVMSHNDVFTELTRFLPFNVRDGEQCLHSEVDGFRYSPISLASSGNHFQSRSCRSEAFLIDPVTSVGRLRSSPSTP